ncbi:MAG: histidine kinase [Geobacter sp.]|nr:MAG: histidine kinase [Geobacter sp.]
MPPLEKILVIDDSKVSQMLVRDILVGSYELTFRDDARSGIVAVKTVVPDLILLDVRLPDRDGFDVCRELKNDETTRDIPIIFITTMDAESERVRGFDAGAEDYVVKPFSLHELLARVKVHLASRKARRQEVELERLNLFREMAVALSHEINNPLTTVYAYLHLLQKEIGHPSEEFKQALDGILQEVGRIRLITERMAKATEAVTTNYRTDIRMIDLHNI